MSTLLRFARLGERRPWHILTPEGGSRCECPATSFAASPTTERKDVHEMGDRDFAHLCWACTKKGAASKRNYQQESIERTADRLVYQSQRHGGTGIAPPNDAWRSQRITADQVRMLGTLGLGEKHCNWWARGRAADEIDRRKSLPEKPEPAACFD